MDRKKIYKDFLLFSSEKNMEHNCDMSKSYLVTKCPLFVRNNPMVINTWQSDLSKRCCCPQLVLLEEDCALANGDTCLVTRSKSQGRQNESLTRF